MLNIRKIIVIETEVAPPGLTVVVESSLSAKVVETSKIVNLTHF